MEYLDEHSDFERLIGRAPEDDGVVAANAPLEPVKKPEPVKPEVKK